MSVLTGLDKLLGSKQLQGALKGGVAYLCHGASVDRNVRLGVYGLKLALGDRLKKLLSPQHGMFGDVQANMIETGHSHNSYFDLPVWSLYSETRIPTDEMLEGIETVVVDLQDVGTRVYTYIHTLTHLMERCGEKDINVVVLDRPNPIGGVDVEGNVLDPHYASFVGRHPVPMRHGLTIGEAALLARDCFGASCDLEVIEMSGWQRDMYFEQTALPWVLPSPNIPSTETAFPYVGTVLYEGVTVSEGRGTTRVFETIGHPEIEPFSLLEKLEKEFQDSGLEGFVLRPLFYLPTFDKFKEQECGGYQIHVTDRKKFKPWRVAQLLLRELKVALGDSFQWLDPPYEYEYEKLPIDILNGSNLPREWVESGGSFGELEQLEMKEIDVYLGKRDGCLLYK